MCDTSSKTALPKTALPKTDAAKMWAGVWLLAAAHVLAFADRFLIAVVAPAMKSDLALSDFQIGLLQGTAFVATFAVATLLCGPLVDVAHRPRLVGAGILIWSAASAACGFTTSMGELVGARLLLGLGQACLTPAALSLIAARQRRSHLGRGVSVYTAGATVGRSAALVLGGGLLALLPATLTVWPFSEPVAAWRALFLLGILPNLVLACVFLSMAEPARRDGSPREVWTRQRLTPWLVRHARRYAAHTLAAAAAILIVHSVTAWTVVLYVRRFGMTVPAAGSTFGLIAVFAAPLGHLAGGRILDALTRRWPRSAAALVFAGALTAVPAAAAVYCLSGDPALSLAALAIVIFVLGLTTPAALAGLQTMTPHRLRGRATALFVAVVTAAGVGIGPPLIGFLSDRVFGETGLGRALLTVVVAAAALGLAGAVASLRAPRYGPSRP